MSRVPRALLPVLLAVLATLLLVPPTLPASPGGPRSAAPVPATALGSARAAGTLLPGISPNVTVWTNLGNLTGGGAPPARAYPGLTFDPVADAAVLFGGRNAAGLALNDTWGLGPTWTWVRRGLPSSPSPRWGAALAFDPSSNVTILFGGTSRPDRFDADTWRLTPVGWAPLQPAQSPGARAYAALAVAPNGSGLVLTGGLGPNGSYADTWWFHAGTWTNETALLGNGPSGRWQAALCRNGSGGVDYLFGGNSSGGPLGDTWRLNASAWARVAVPAPPVARSGAACAFDAVDGVAVVFGGVTAGGAPLGRALAFNGSAWTNTSIAGAHPPARAGAGFAEVGAFGRGIDLLFGGAPAGGGALGGSWAFGTRIPVIVAPVSVSPSVTDPGFPVNLSGLALGGVPPYRFAWSGLPPNCTSQDAASLRCVPGPNGSQPGSYAPVLQATDAMGVVGQGPAGALLVNPPLALDQIVVYPATLSPGTNLTVQAIATGGGLPRSYAYAGLPPGCASANQSTIVCVPRVAGTYRVTVDVYDPFGLEVAGSAVISVVGSSSSLPVLLWAVLVGLAVIVVLLAAVWLRRRRGRPGRPKGRSGAAPAAAARTRPPPPRP